MKPLVISALALTATIALPLGATAATNSGTVCGRVNASPSQIIALLVDPTQPGTVIARSGTEVVQTNIGTDGTYCFEKLHPDLHTIVAFGESADYKASVTPVDGKTLRLDLYAASGE